MLMMFIRNTVEVQALSLDPQQQRVSQKRKISSNYFAKRFVKCVQMAEFTNYYGLLFSALFEADAEVISFVPRPFRLKVLGKPHTPDFFVTRRSYREVLDIEKNANLTIQHKLIKEFFERNGVSYSVVAQHQLKLQQTKAESWLQIVSLLKTTECLTTTYEEDSIIAGLMSQTIHTLGDVIDTGDRAGSLLKEVALFRLLHGGYVQANLDHHPLNYDTLVTLC